MSSSPPVKMLKKLPPPPAGKKPPPPGGLVLPPKPSEPKEKISLPSPPKEIPKAIPVKVLPKTPLKEPLKKAIASPPSVLKAPAPPLGKVLIKKPIPPKEGQPLNILLEKDSDSISSFLTKPSLTLKPALDIPPLKLPVKTPVAPFKDLEFKKVLPIGVPTSPPKPAETPTKSVTVEAAKSSVGTPALNPLKLPAAAPTKVTDATPLPKSGSVIISKPPAVALTPLTAPLKSASIAGLTGGTPDLALAPKSVPIQQTKAPVGVPVSSAVPQKAAPVVPAIAARPLPAGTPALSVYDSLAPIPLPPADLPTPQQDLAATAARGASIANEIDRRILSYELRRAELNRASNLGYPPSSRPSLAVDQIHPLLYSPRGLVAGTAVGLPAPLPSEVGAYSIYDSMAPPRPQAPALLAEVPAYASVYPPAQAPPQAEEMCQPVRCARCGKNRCPYTPALEHFSQFQLPKVIEIPQQVLSDKKSLSSSSSSGSSADRKRKKSAGRERKKVRRHKREVKKKEKGKHEKRETKKNGKDPIRVGYSQWENVERKIARSRGPPPSEFHSADVSSQENDSSRSTDSTAELKAVRYRGRKLWPDREFINEAEKRRGNMAVRAGAKFGGTGPRFTKGYEGGLTNHSRSPYRSLGELANYYSKLEVDDQSETISLLLACRKLERQIEEQYDLIDMLDRDLAQAQETLKLPPDWEGLKAISPLGPRPPDVLQLPDQQLPLYLKGRVLLRASESGIPKETQAPDPDLAAAIEKLKADNQKLQKTPFTFAATEPPIPLQVKKKGPTDNAAAQPDQPKKFSRPAGQLGKPTTPSIKGVSSPSKPLASPLATKSGPAIRSTLPSTPKPQPPPTAVLKPPIAAKLTAVTPPQAPRPPTPAPAKPAAAPSAPKPSPLKEPAPLNKPPPVGLKPPAPPKPPGPGAPAPPRPPVLTARPPAAPRPPGSAGPPPGLAKVPRPLASKPPAPVPPKLETVPSLKKSVSSEVKTMEKAGPVKQASSDTALPTPSPSKGPPKIVPKVKLGPPPPMAKKVVT